MEQEPQTQPLGLDGSESREVYINEYLPQMFEEYAKLTGHVPPKKAIYQLHLQKTQIGDPDTWLVPAYDLDSAENVVNHLKNEGREDIWFSICHPNGYNEGNRAYQNPVNTPLFRESDIPDPQIWTDRYVYMDKDSGEQQTLTKYLNNPDNCDVILKIFPQDGKNQSNLTFVYDNGGEMVIKLKLNAHTHRDKAKAIEMSIEKSPFDPQKLVIFVENPEDIQILFPLFNSPDFIKKFDDLSERLNNPDAINPEMMITIPDNDAKKLDESKIQFVFDLITVNQIANQPPHKNVPLTAFVNKLRTATVMPKKNKTELIMLSTVLTQLSEASQGTPPNSTEFQKSMSYLKFWAAEIPSLYLPALKAIQNLSNTTEVNPLNGKSKTASGRLNSMYQSEKPSFKVLGPLIARLNMLCKNNPTVSELLNPK